MVRIHNVVWVRTLYSLVCGYVCFGGAFWSYLHRPLEHGGSMSSMKPWYPPVRLHGLITLNIRTANLNILRFPCIASLFITNQLHIFRNKYMLLF